MPVFALPRRIAFPDPALAEPAGLVAVGGDLTPERLLAAYAAGIFPWYQAGMPICWWSPDPRLVLEPARLHVSRSLAKTMRAGLFETSFDRAFERVIRRCADKPRAGQEGTWITEEMMLAYQRLHELGFAHSAEAWQDGELAGGVYGIALGGAFFGESMFADRPDASKVAFVRLVEALAHWSFDLIDCQVTTPHLLRFGAEELPRAAFLERLARTIERPTGRGAWSLAE